MKGEPEASSIFDERLPMGPKTLGSVPSGTTNHKEVTTESYKSFLVALAILEPQDSARELDITTIRNARLASRLSAGPTTPMALGFALETERGGADP